MCYFSVTMTMLLVHKLPGRIINFRIVRVDCALVVSDLQNRNRKWVRALFKKSLKTHISQRDRSKFGLMARQLSSTGCPAAAAAVVVVVGPRTWPHAGSTTTSMLASLAPGTDMWALPSCLRHFRAHGHQTGQFKTCTYDHSDMGKLWKRARRRRQR